MFGSGSTISTPFARFAFRLANFVGKPRREQLMALKATFRHHLRSVTGQPIKWEDSAKLRRLITGKLALPSVLAAKSRLYVAYRPDADFDFNLYPELQALSAKWVWNNSITNGGDLPRLYALAMNIKQVMTEGIAGNFAELGVYRGNSAAVLAHYARQHDRMVYLFDTFKGFETTDLTGIDADKSLEFSDTSLDLVRQNVGDKSIIYLTGYFPASITETVTQSRFAVVHLDCDLYEPMKSGLEFFYARLSAGGLIIMHDYANPHWQGAKRAIDEFMTRVNDNLILIPDKSGTAMIRKALA